MPDTRELVANTGPIIALIAALGDLKLLDSLYERVVVPLEVCQEILAGNATHYGATEFQRATWLEKRSEPTEISPFLRNALDPGEAAVIQVALQEKIRTVCIDEDAGRRMARLNGLRVTGSLGMLIRAKREGHHVILSEAVKRMQSRRIRLTACVIQSALRQAGES